jgi:hypothetical protein
MPEFKNEVPESEYAEIQNAKQKKNVKKIEWLWDTLESH